METSPVFQRRSWKDHFLQRCILWQGLPAPGENGYVTVRTSLPFVSPFSLSLFTLAMRVPASEEATEGQCHYAWVTSLAVICTAASSPAASTPCSASLGVSIYRLNCRSRWHFLTWWETNRHAAGCENVQRNVGCAPVELTQTTMK